MGRKRTRDTDLPERVYRHHGAFVYKPKGGKAIALCKERAHVESEYARHVAGGLIAPRATSPLLGGTCTIRQAIKKYRTEELVKMAEATQELYSAYLTKFEAVFGDARPEQVRPKAIYAFRSQVTKSKGVQALITHVIRALYSHMIEWGMTDMNPAREVRCESTKKRDRCPDAGDIAAVKARAVDPILPLYIDFKLAYGLRQLDMLNLRPIPVGANEFKVEIHKSMRWDPAKGRRVGDEVIFEVSDETREILRAIYALPRPQSTVALFCTRRGKRYNQTVFQRRWRDAMASAARLDGVEPFHEHDLRATTGTADPGNAQKRLTHKAKTTTDDYLRTFGVERVKPLEKARIPAKSLKIFSTKG